MQTTLTRGPKKVAYRLIILQTMVTLLLALTILLTLGQTSAWAVLVSGAGVVLANSVFAVFLFRGREIQQATRIIARFYLGEALKLILSAVFIAWAITQLGVAAIPFLLTYVVLQMLICPIGIMGGNRSFGTN